MFTTETHRGLTVEPPGCQQRWVRVQSTGVREGHRRNASNANAAVERIHHGPALGAGESEGALLWVSQYCGWAQQTGPDSGVLRCCNTSGGGGEIHLGNGNGDASMLWVRLEKVSPGSRGPPRSRWCHLRCYQTLLGCVKIVKVDVLTIVECFFSALTLQDRAPM